MSATEAEWETCTSTGRLVAFVRNRLGARKPRLLACAGVRQVWPVLAHAGMRQAVEAGERNADGELTDPELSLAQEAAWQAMGRPDLAAFAAMASTLQDAALAAREAVMHAGTAAAKVAAAAAGKVPAGQASVTWEALADPERRAADAAWQTLGTLVRCSAGNPFRPAAIDPAVRAWRDGLLVATARRMYESRDFGEMPVLADMLEDAGCREPQVVAHCRGPGPHARGCFAVDRILCRE